MEGVFSYEKKDDDDCYHVLGCTENSSKDQILAEFRARVLEVHPDKNPGDPHAEDRFKLLQLAKDVLIDPETRQRYDKWRSSGIALPFKTWTALGKNVETSMHWATYHRKENHMLEGPPLDVASCPSSSKVRLDADEDLLSAHNCGRQPWERDPCSNVTLQRFRNYEI